MDVIVPTTGKRYGLLEDCIVSLKQQSSPVNIVVVLGKSNSETAILVSELCKKHNCKLLHEPDKPCEGSHRAVACNYALNFCYGKYVAFVDDDVTVPVDWAEKCLSYFMDGEVIAGVTSGCKLENSPFHLVQTIGSDSHSKVFGEIVSVQSVPGYNSVYVRKILDDVGGFNEEIGGCEDWELNYRIRKKGYCLLGVPEVPVVHRQNYSWRGFSKQMFGYGFSRARLAKKGRVFTVKHTMPLLGLVLLLFSVLEPVLFLFLISGVLYVFCVVSAFLLYANLASFKLFFKTVEAFVVMYLSWALGYLKGLF